MFLPLLFFTKGTSGGLQLLWKEEMAVSASCRSALGSQPGWGRISGVLSRLCPGELGEGSASVPKLSCCCWAPEWFPSSWSGWHQSASLVVSLEYFKLWQTVSLGKLYILKGLGMGMHTEAAVRMKKCPFKRANRNTSDQKYCAPSPTCTVWGCQVGLLREGAEPDWWQHCCEDMANGFISG